MLVTCDLNSFFATYLICTSKNVEKYILLHEVTYFQVYNLPALFPIAISQGFMYIFLVKLSSKTIHYMYHILNLIKLHISMEVNILIA